MSAEHDLIAEPIVVKGHVLKVRGDSSAVLFQHENLDGEGYNRLYPYSRDEINLIGAGDLPTAIQRVAKKIISGNFAQREWRPFDRLLRRYSAPPAL